MELGHANRYHESQMLQHSKPEGSKGNRGMKKRCAVAAWLAISSVFAPIPVASATWSILIVNGRTKEIAVGSATCLTNFDLQQNLPVVLVDVGAACAQSLVDVGANNRMVIWNELLAGTDPDEIIAILAEINNQHQSRQYGIVDTQWQATTFTGTSAGQWRGGVVGFEGDIYYAIQGNVLTGEPVVEQAELAVLNTPGDLPTKLMAAMEAARAMGGDGRCSCSAIDPTSCGAPPVEFEKSAHIGFMIVARSGDTDGVCTSSQGCANGDYFLELNVPFQTSLDPDPVFQLQDMLDVFRAEHVGRPDAVHSEVVVSPQAVPGIGTHQSSMIIQVVDWQDAPVTDPSLAVTIQHAAGSAGLATIGEVAAIAPGIFGCILSTSGGVGRDRFRVTVNDGIRPVVLIPYPGLILAARADFDMDGDVDLVDFEPLTACMAGPAHPVSPTCPPADFDADLDIDLLNFAEFARSFTAPPCRFLHITQQPVASFHPCGTPFDVIADAMGDPAPQYQWFLNGVAIPGATAAAYHVDSATNADHGFYSCRISNTCESIMTNSVLVRVFPNPCP